MLKIINLFLFLFVTLHGYESEDTIKVTAIGKIAKYVTCKNKKLENFTITILKNPYGDLFNKVYANAIIDQKKVKIIYINRLEELRDTHVLYIPKLSASKVNKILDKTRSKNIITISDNRGFAQRGGLIQFYFVSQKLKIKINTQSANMNHIKIQPALLRISELVKGEVS